MFFLLVDVVQMGFPELLYFTLVFVLFLDEGVDNGVVEVVVLVEGGDDVLDFLFIDGLSHFKFKSEVFLELADIFRHLLVYLGYLRLQTLDPYQPIVPLLLQLISQILHILYLLSQSHHLLLLRIHFQRTLLQVL